MITPTPHKKILSIFILTVFVLFVFWIIPAKADGTAGSLPFSQGWTNTNLITTNDVWSGVPSIIGYLGDYSAAAPTAVDPQTILADDSGISVDVIANQTNTGITNGGVAEFQITDPTIALQGSGTADAPYIKIFLDTTNTNQVQVAYDVKDIDGSTDNAVQQVALHYRAGSSGVFTNIPAAYIADATSGPSLATLVTHINVALPSAAENQSHVELRIMTTNAAGNDEWVGIDNISITANHAPTGVSISPNAILENRPSGTTVGTLTAADPDPTDSHTFALTSSALCPDNAYFSLAGNTITTAASFDFEMKSSYSICAQVTDNYGLSKTASIQVDILDVADEIPPAMSNSNPASGAVFLAGPAQFTIQFNEDVKHDSSAGAANNTANFLLVEAGANLTFETASCRIGAAAADVSIAINAAAYQNKIVTLNINGGVPLSAGSYRLFICGTTSIEDLLGNKLNNGASDTLINFTVSAALINSKIMLPVTGFPMEYETRLPAQPEDKKYASFSDLWLEIPKLAVSTPIVGVPLTADGWDVAWLGKDAGWLNQTAFPSWAGNSVITAHVWDAYNQPGIFYNLKSLQYGDMIKVHAFGQVYSYEVRQTKQIAPNDFPAVLKHEDNAWLTLITCEDYKPQFQTYSYRRMVRAVLASVVPEK